ncbi:MAG: hypothetical protein JSS66_09045 [Armatimonadetes bacterium]|nr:hypothetical protein [Armatimonadota bacterium]
MNATVLLFDQCLSRLDPTSANEVEETLVQRLSEREMMLVLRDPNPLNQNIGLTYFGLRIGCAALQGQNYRALRLISQTLCGYEAEDVSRVAFAVLQGYVDKARDSARDQFRRSPADVEALWDATCLSLELDDLESYKELFYEAKSQGTEFPRRNQVLRLVLTLGDVGWLRDLIGDPTEELDAITQRSRTMRDNLKKDPRWPQVEPVLARGQAEDLAVLLKAVQLTHGVQAARELQLKALNLLDHPAVRAALD